MSASRSKAVLHLDPSCPFSWVTQRWLAEVESLGAVELELSLLGLGPLNEGKDVDPAYRQSISESWKPARVMVAVAQRRGSTEARRFYEAFGRRLHVEHDNSPAADRLALCIDALAEAGLPAELIEAATDTSNDDTLRSLTRAALDLVGLHVGTPVLQLDGVFGAGPILSAVPRGQDAVDLFTAVRAASRVAGFVRFERRMEGPLRTGT